MTDYTVTISSMFMQLPVVYFIETAPGIWKLPFIMYAGAYLILFIESVGRWTE